MAAVESSILIDRVVEDVYAYVTDVDKMTEWRRGLVEVEKVTEGRLGSVPGFGLSPRGPGDAARWKSN